MGWLASIGAALDRAINPPDPSAQARAEHWQWGDLANALEAAGCKNAHDAIVKAQAAGLSPFRVALETIEVMGRAARGWYGARGVESIPAPDTCAKTMPQVAPTIAAPETPAAAPETPAPVPEVAPRKPTAIELLRERKAAMAATAGPLEVKPAPSRADGIATLIALGIKAGEAAAKVDAAMRSNPETIEALVKTALKGKP